MFDLANTVGSGLSYIRDGLILYSYILYFQDNCANISVPLQNPRYPSTDR